MRVFLSWSGDISRMVVQGLAKLLEDTIQAVDPWVSTRNLEPGTRWHIELSKALKDCRFGILCLTHDSASDWVMFESGALSKELDDAFLCPYLVSLPPDKLPKPLRHFQHATTSREDTFRLLEAVNARTDRPMQSDRLRRYFEQNWPSFERLLATIPRTRPRFDAPDNFLGLEGVFATRPEALKHFLACVHEEFATGSDRAFWWTVGSSLAGLLNEKDYREVIQGAAAARRNIRFMLTALDVAHLRERQEGRPHGSIAREIAASTQQLKHLGVQRESARYYRGTPTIFAMATSRYVFLNPYPYEQDARCSLSMIFRRTTLESDVYSQYMEAHFNRPWNGTQSIEIAQATWKNEARVRAQAVSRNYLQPATGRKAMNRRG